MKKVIGIILGVFLGLALLTSASGYGYLWYRYRDTFMPGLSVNNVYAADLTVDALNKQLKKNMEIPVVTVTNKEGKSYQFSMEEADYDENYTKDLATIQNGQHVMELLKYMFSNDAKLKTRELFPVISYDEEQLADFLDEQKYLEDDSDPLGKRIEVRQNQRGEYYLYDETTDMLNHEKAVNLISEKIKNKEYDITLTEKDCYDTPQWFNSKQQQALDDWNLLKPYMKTEIDFNFGGRKETIGASQIAEWIMLNEDGTFMKDEEGHLVLDEDAIDTYVKDMCDKYSTVNKPRTIKTTRGDMVTIEKGTYGSKVDYKKELEYVKWALPNGLKTSRTPEYTQVPFSGLTGINDIGTTYIEVDMTNQHLYYYVNGKLKLDSDVVTGNTSLGRGTPERVCYVYFKQRNRTLRGEDYATFVNYWMAVYNNIGIHDANWRGRFGGTIYKTAGSHGCVNTPISKVSELYEMVEVGTPVLLYY